MFSEEKRAREKGHAGKKGVRYFRIQRIFCGDLLSSWCSAFLFARSKDRLFASRSSSAASRRRSDRRPRCHVGRKRSGETDFFSSYFWKIFSMWTQCGKMERIFWVDFLLFPDVNNNFIYFIMISGDWPGLINRSSIQPRLDYPKLRLSEVSFI